jgi:hypothetical protein
MMSYEGANAISVAPGLSDLEELIEMLRSYPHVEELSACCGEGGEVSEGRGYWGRVFEYGGGDELLEGVGTG